MAKIIYLFKCIWDPTKIRSFKKMSIFVALLIFVIQFFMVVLPSKLYLKNHVDEVADTIPETYALYNIKDTSNKFALLKDTNLKVEYGTPSSNSEEVNTYEFVYYHDETNICVIIVLDIDEKLNDVFNNYANDYKEVYIDETDETRINMIAQMICYDTNFSEDSKTVIFEKYHAMETNDIKELVNDIPYYEFYGIKGKESNTNYAYIFNKESIMRYYEEENDIYSYTYLDIDVNDYDNMEDFGKEISLQMAVKYNEYAFDYYMLYIVLYVLVLPILASIIMFLFNRKYKFMTNVLDYYKVASLATIIPAILACIMSFIFGPAAKSVYVVLMLVFGMYMLFKASSMPDYEDNKNTNKNTN